MQYQFCIILVFDSSYISVLVISVYPVCFTA